MAADDISLYKEQFMLFTANNSTAPTAGLPGWDAVNDVLLDALWDQLPQYGIREAWKDELNGATRWKHDRNTISPGYRARMMAERAGMPYFELLHGTGIPFDQFKTGGEPGGLVREQIQAKIASLAPMDAINMLTALLGSFGDEVSARYLYDTAWQARFQHEQQSEALSRFLLNHGRSFVFNFQDRIERARSAGIHIEQLAPADPPPGLEDVFTNPAKMNLQHQQNTAPETPGLIALAQTFLGNPILFKDFPKALGPYFRREPTVTEMADIIYYYSYYALLYGDLDNIGFLHFAIQEMEAAADEPRLCQLLSRRAMIKFQLDHPEVLASAQKDLQQARELAEKYRAPHLMALTALAMAIGARKEKRFEEALQYIQQAEKGFAALNRIPQYMETIVEYLKVMLLGFSGEAVSKQFLLTLFLQIDEKVSGDYVKRIAAYEAEYCFHGGLLIGNYTDAPRQQVVSWFADALFRAEHCHQQKNVDHYRDTCKRFRLLDEVEALVGVLKKQYI